MEEMLMLAALDAREVYPFEPTAEDWADYEEYIDEQGENWSE